MRPFCFSEPFRPPAMTAPDARLADSAFLTREPVLDRQQLLAGYEIALAGTLANDAANLAQTFTTLGLGRVLSGCRAFISIDSAQLMDARVETLPADLVVLQLTPEQIAQPELWSRCQTLQSLGYSFCLDGLSLTSLPNAACSEIATYFKFDLAQTRPEDLQALTSELRALRRPLIAKGIATQEHRDLCALLGVELFQGYFFAQASVSESKVLEPSAQAIFRLIGEIAGDAEIDELETTLRSEPALIVNLLRLTNSVGAGARTRITSVRHAIAVLGRRQLMRWLQLLLFRSNGQGDIGGNALMQYAALRGRFMELLAARLMPAMPRLADPAFMTGLLSVLPAALGLSMRDILAQLSVDDQVQLALVHRDGDIGRLLALLDAYDANDFATTSTLLATFPDTQPAHLAEILVQALDWVQSLKADQ